VTAAGKRRCPKKGHKVTATDKRRCPKKGRKVTAAGKRRCPKKRHKVTAAGKRWCPKKRLKVTAIGKRRCPNWFTRLAYFTKISTYNALNAFFIKNFCYPTNYKGCCLNFEVNFGHTCVIGPVLTTSRLLDGHGYSGQFVATALANTFHLFKNVFVTLSYSQGATRGLIRGGSELG